MLSVLNLHFNFNKKTFLIKELSHKEMRLPSLVSTTISNTRFDKDHRNVSCRFHPFCESYMSPLLVNTGSCDFI